MRDLGRRAFSGFLWAGAGRCRSAGCWCSPPRSCSRACWCRASSASSPSPSRSSTTSSTSADLGLGAALIYRSDAEDPRVSSTAFWIGIAGSLVLFAACWFAAPLLAEIGPGDEVVPLFRVLALQFPLSALGKAHEYRLRRTLAFRTLFGPTFAGRADKGVVSVVARGGRRRRVEPRDRPAGRHAGAVDRALAGPPVPPRSHVSRRHLAPMLRFGLGIVAVGMLGQGAKNFDYLVVGGKLGAVRARRLLPRLPAARAGDPHRLPRRQGTCCSRSTRGCGRGRWRNGGRRPAAGLPADRPARRDGGLARRPRHGGARGAARADALRGALARGRRTDSRSSRSGRAWRRSRPCRERSSRRSAARGC